jgi:hypothetical protein
MLLRTVINVSLKNKKDPSPQRHQSRRCATNIFLNKKDPSPQHHQSRRCATNIFLNKK